jgi:hypothetical protein
MMPKLKQGATCPIAALMKKTACLGNECAWYASEPGGCLIYSLVDMALRLDAQHQEIAKAFQSTQELDKKMETALAEILELRDALKAKLAEAGADA